MASYYRVRVRGVERDCELEREGGERENWEDAKSERKRGTLGGTEGGRERVGTQEHLNSMVKMFR